uniref:Golgin subfamily A conserved domain-containing protein n=1 Tax=Callithrix jacchus TaxID=9483 RepID=A0A8I3X392_CALJA
MLLSFSFSTCLAFLPKGHIQTINILTSENGRLKTALYHMGRAARHFEEESSKLAGCLQKALQQREELERTLSAVSSQQDKADRSSPHCEAVLERQLQHSRKELALLKAHMTQMTASLHQVQLERDECCQHLKGERFRWQQGMRKISQEVLTLKLEKRQDAHHMQELERSLAHLRNQLAEAPGTEPPVGPLVAEQQLKFETNLLRKNLESLTEQLQAQVKNNENLNRLSSEQKKRLRQQEESLQEQKERMRLQEEELNNEKKNTLQLVQQIKELQEKLHNQKMTEHLEAATQENQQPQDQLGLTTLPGEGMGNHSEEEERAPRGRGTVNVTPLFLLQSGFMTLRKEEVDLKERVEKLELLFIRLSEETDTMRKDIKSYEQQKAVPKPWHQEEVEKREIKVRRLEQQEPVFPILGDNEGHATFLATAKNHVDEPAPGTPAPQELETVNKQDLCEVSLADSMEPARDAREGSPQGNPTVGNIEHLSPVFSVFGMGVITFCGAF